MASEYINKAREKPTLGKKEDAIVILIKLLELGVSVGTIVLELNGELKTAIEGRAIYNLGIGTLNEALERKTGQKKLT